MIKVHGRSLSQNVQHQTRALKSTRFRGAEAGVARHLMSPHRRPPMGGEGQIPQLLGRFTKYDKIGSGWPRLSARGGGMDGTARWTAG